MSVQESRAKLAASTDTSSGFDELERILAAAETEQAPPPPPGSPPRRPAFADSPAVVHASLPSSQQQQQVSQVVMEIDDTESEGEEEKPNGENRVVVVPPIPPPPGFLTPSTKTSEFKHGLPPMHLFTQPTPYDFFEMNETLYNQAARMVRIGFVGYPGDCAYGPCIFYYHPRLKLYVVRGYDYLWPTEQRTRRLPYVCRNVSRTLYNPIVRKLLGNPAMRARDYPKPDSVSLDNIWLMWHDPWANSGAPAARVALEGFVGPDNAPPTFEVSPLAVEGFTGVDNRTPVFVSFNNSYVRHDKFWASRVPANGKCDMRQCVCEQETACCPWLKDHGGRMASGSIAKTRAVDALPPPQEAPASTNRDDMIDLSSV